MITKGIIIKYQLPILLQIVDVKTVIIVVFKHFKKSLGFLN